MKLEKQTAAFIRRLQTSAPVKIINIAKVLGLNVWESKSLPDGIAGKIFRDPSHGGSMGYSIVIRSQDPAARKRFTAAHELAHYLLHRHLIKGELLDDALYRSKLSTPIEAEANNLAADLLMPWHLLAPLANKPIPDLAELFEVSEQAMAIRMSSGVPYASTA
jgi:hypothetical protein